VVAQHSKRIAGKVTVERLYTLRHRDVTMVGCVNYNCNVNMAMLPGGTVGATC